MKLALAALVAATGMAMVAADCPNACSGNGQCSSNHDYCQCYEGFTGADCSLRVCPFASSFIDLPQGDLTHDNALDTGGSSRTQSPNANGVAAGSALNPDYRVQGFWERHPSQLYGTADQIGTLVGAVREDEAHFAAECAGVGLCDRGTGQCSCFPGYGGAACNRTVCPNDCSGHGICRSLAETLPASIEWYRLWESTKNVRCVCDAGFSGLDCSERVCPRGDDPLTTTTTTKEYNDGLAETAEVQYADVRCKFGGTAINPLVRIGYTDADTKSTYTTEYFKLGSATSAEVMAMLKGLPNDVLADYAVDGVVISNRLSSVAITALETDNFWRIALTFDKSLGDVPSVTVDTHPSFLCKNALDVDTGLGGYESRENVAALAVGDGPSKKLIFDFTIFTDETAGAADQASYVVYGEGLTALDTTTPQAVDMDPFTGDTFRALPNAALFDREAALVTFAFEGADGKGTGPNDIRSSESRAGLDLVYRLTYDPIPAVKVSNPTSNLDNVDLYWRQIRQVYTSSNGTREDTIDGDGLWFDRPASQTPNYDLAIEIANGPSYTIHTPYQHARSVAESRAELVINGEHIAYINGSFDFTNTTYSLFGAISNSSIYGYRAPQEFINNVPGTFWANTTTDQQAVVHGNSSFVVFTPKFPLVTKATGVDTIDVAYRDNEAVNQSVTLVIKIVSTSSSPDTFAWKFAGDSAFMDNNGAGYPVPTAASGFNALPAVQEYVTSREDEGRRWQASRILLHWTNGDDFDQRVACTSGTSNFYYIQFGAAGLNDRPQCADRGICDAASGECSCYAGYTGADCSEQNALARGGRSSSSA